MDDIADFDAPIDPMNPLGYSPPDIADFDHVSRPCFDFHKTLGWAFWRGAFVLQDGGTFEHVRHLRHLILQGLKERKFDIGKLRTPYYDYDVGVSMQGASAWARSTRVMISRTHAKTTNLDAFYNHVVVTDVIDEMAIEKAMLLNRDLQQATTPQHRPSPFGPADIVMPGNFDYAAYKEGMISSFTTPTPAYRTVRLMPDRTQTLEDALTLLSVAGNTDQIQRIFRTLPIGKMPKQEFSQFVKLVALRAEFFDSK